MNNTKKTAGETATTVTNLNDLVDDVKMYLESGFYDENRLYFEKLRASDEVFSDLESAIQSVEISNCLRERKATYVKK